MLERDKDERLHGLDDLTALSSKIEAIGYLVEVLLALQMIEKDGPLMARDLIDKAAHIADAPLIADPKVARHRQRHVQATLAQIERLVAKAARRAGIDGSALPEPGDR